MIAIDSPSLVLVTGLVARVTVVLALAWLGARIAARWSASTRHAVWVAAFVAVLALPVAGRLLPAWRLPVLPAAEPSAPAVVPALPSDPSSIAQARSGLALPINQRTALPTLGTRDQTTARAAESALVARSKGIELSTWALALWGAVGALLVLRYLAGLLAVARLTRRARSMDDPRWLDALDIACATLDVARAPRLLVSDAVAMPFTCGFFRATLVVPESALGWTDERIDVVVRHELAHVARRDCAVQAVAHAACALYWFHPLTWIGARHLRAERERACDDLVLASGTRGTTYAEHLLDIARAATVDSSPLAAAALAMARPSELEGRLLAILDPRRERGRAGRRRIVQVALAGVAVVMPLAGVNLVARTAVLPSEPQTATADSAAQTPSSAEPSAPVRTAPQTTHPAEPAKKASSPGEHDVVEDAPPDLVSALSEGVAEGVSGGVSRGVPGGIAGGITGGIAGGVRVHGHGPGAGNGLGLGQGAVLAGDEQEKPVSAAVVKALTEALKDSDADVRKSAMQALARFHSPLAYDAFLAGLKDGDADVRQQAAFGLSQLRDPRAADALVLALKDSDAEVRQQAAFALSQLRTPASVPALTAALKDSDDEVREQALFALSQIRDASALPALTAALSDSKANVRQQAAFAISQIGDERAVPALVAALKDSDAEVREQAAFALSQMGDESAIEPLTALLKDPSAEVRQQAVFALSQIAGGERRHHSQTPPPPPPGRSLVAPPPPAPLTPPPPR